MWEKGGRVNGGNKGKRLRMLKMGRVEGRNKLEKWELRMVKCGNG